MGQVLHGCATTAETIRRAIQHSQESLRALAKRYGINPETVAKWRHRSSVADLPAGPKAPKSTVLLIEDEAIIAAFRRHTLLPLDDCLYALQPGIPHLTRSSLHRCLQRHGISQLPDAEGTSLRRRSSKPTRLASSTSALPKCGPEKASSIPLPPSIERRNSSLSSCMRKRPPRLPPNSFAILSRPCPTKSLRFSPITVSASRYQAAGLDCWRDQRGIANGALFRAHAFELACARNDTGHRLTKPKHPWTNGQVERMNRTIKEATVQRFYYESHQQLRQHLADFAAAYNFGRRLKTLKGLTPFEYICKSWTSQSLKDAFSTRSSKCRD
jgi:hypothetical protein